MIHVEFYGIPRQHAKTAEAAVEGATLGAVLANLGQQYPDFAAHCLASDGTLHPAFIANQGGGRFIRHPATPLDDRETILILSSDAGG